MVGVATYSRRCIHVVSNCCNTSKKKRKKNFPELKHKKQVGKALSDSTKKKKLKEILSLCVIHNRNVGMRDGHFHLVLKVSAGV